MYVPTCLAFGRHPIPGLRPPSLVCRSTLVSCLLGTFGFKLNTHRSCCRRTPHTYSITTLPPNQASPDITISSERLRIPCAYVRICACIPFDRYPLATDNFGGEINRLTTYYKRRSTAPRRRRAFPLYLPCEHHQRASCKRETGGFNSSSKYEIFAKSSYPNSSSRFTHLRHGWPSTVCTRRCARRRKHEQHPKPVKRCTKSHH